jgi:hypothetical protein
MKDKAKEQYRANIFQLIEKLENIVNVLKVRANRYSPPPRPSPRTPEEEALYDMQSQGDALNIQLLYRLSPDDPNTTVFVDSISELYSSLNSKEGTRMLPRGLYRLLIEFGDKCIARKKWAEGIFDNINIDETEEMSEEEIIKQAAERNLNQKKKNFLEEINVIKREIYYYENERDESDESFFGSSGDNADS